MLEECGLPYECSRSTSTRAISSSRSSSPSRRTTRFRRIVDPDGPGGKPISVFESGAILQYLGRKTGVALSARRAPPRRGRRSGCSGRSAASGRWRGRRTISATMRQEKIPYGIERYTNEVNAALRRARPRGSRAGITLPATIPSPTSRAFPGRGPGRTRARISPSFPTWRRGSSASAARPAVKRRRAARALATTRRREGPASASRRSQSLRHG